MQIPKELAAKARLTMDNGAKLYLEVRAGSNFHNFYTTYTVHRRGRGRVIDLHAPRPRGFADSIEEAAEKIARTTNQDAKRTGESRVADIKIWIYRKRLYRERFQTPPDILGLTRVNCPWTDRHSVATPTHFMESKAALLRRLLIHQEANH